MKKVLSILIIAIGIMSGARAFEANIYQVYPACGVILEEPGEVVTITMQNGNRFEFFNDDGDWMVGDLVAVIFDNRGTPRVNDDIILGKPRYAGWISSEEMQHWVKYPGNVG